MPRFRVLFAGDAEGPLLRLAEPLSFWGGYDPHSGEIVDRRHPDRGATAAGTVLVIPAARGSSSSSSVLAEAARCGKAPAAIVLGATDLILPVGAVVADELYGVRIPVLVGEVDGLGWKNGTPVKVGRDGTVTQARP